MGTSRAYPHSSSMNASDAIEIYPATARKARLPGFDPVSQARIKAQRIVPENLSLDFVTDIFSIDQVGDIVAEIALVALMRDSPKPRSAHSHCPPARQGAMPILRLRRRKRCCPS